MGPAVLRRVTSLVALLALVAFASTARADGAGDAERLFREGVRLRDGGDFASACPKFADSFALDPAPGTLVNLGDCEVRIGKLIAAIEHYKLAVAGFPKGDKRRDLLAQKLVSVEPKLAHLTILVAPTVPETARITRGAAPFDRHDSGVSVTTDPGKLVVVVAAEGRTDSTYDVELGEGQSKELQVDVGAPVPQKPVAPPRAAIAESPPAGTEPRPLRTAGFIVGGVGVAGLGVGVVTGLMAMSKASTVRSHCDTTTYACDSEGVDAAKSGNVLAPVSTVSFIAGGVLLAGGVTMVLLGGKKKESTVSLVPTAGPLGGGAMLVGRF